MIASDFIVPGSLHRATKSRIAEVQRALSQLSEGRLSIGMNEVDGVAVSELGIQPVNTDVSIDILPGLIQKDKVALRNRGILTIAGVQSTSSEDLDNILGSPVATRRIFTALLELGTQHPQDPLEPEAISKKRRN